MNNYRIIAKPSLTYVTQNREMSFLLEKQNANVPDYANNNYQWFCFNDDGNTVQLDYSRLRSCYRGPRGKEWKDAKWTKIGYHRVVCKSQAENKYYEYNQYVVSVNEIIQYSPTSKSEFLDPAVVLANLQKEIRVIRNLEKAQPLNKEEESPYQKRMKDKEEYAERLAYLLNEIPESYKQTSICSFHAEHFSYIYENVNSIPLRMGYFCLGEGDVYLLDWTNPVTQGICGVYKGTGETREAAMEDAIAQWDKQNRYPEGMMQYAYSITYTTVDDAKNGANATLQEGEQGNVTKHVDQDDMIVTSIRKKGSFETDGKDQASFISEVLSYIGLAAAIVAGVVTLVAPIPGSRVVSFAIWTAIATTTTSAVINIADRHMDGFTDYKEDSFDVLTIVGNMFSAGFMSQAKWLRYSVAIQSEAQATSAGTSAIKYALIGQITTDSLQGVMVVADVANAIYTVRNDSTLPADIKLQRIAALISRAVIDGTLVYVSIKGSTVDLGNIKGTQHYSSLSSDQIDELIGGLPQQSTSEISQIKPLQDDLNGLTISQKQLESNAVHRAVERPFTEGQLKHLQGDYAGSDVGNVLTHQIEKEVAVLNKTEFETVRKTEVARNDEIEIGSNNKEDNTNTRETHSKVNDIYARPKCVLEELKDEARVIIASSDSKELRPKAALARTRCPIKGIESRSFVNIKPSGFQYTKLKKQKLAKQEELNNMPGEAGYFYSITDVDQYMFRLNEEYTNVGREIHSEMGLLIRDFIGKHNGRFRDYDGLPGAHAEILSTNDVFHQLQDIGENVSAHFKNIEVVTIRLTPESKQLEDFPACLHCSGILHHTTDIKIITDRIQGSM